MLEGEQAKLLQMEEQLRSAWSDRTTRSRPCPPRYAAPAPASKIQTGRSGSFIFLGPTGVGKTETAARSHSPVCDDERSMVRST